MLKCPRCDFSPFNGARTYLWGSQLRQNLKLGGAKIYVTVYAFRLLQMGDNIVVALRVRPLSKEEVDNNAESVVIVDNTKKQVIVESVVSSPSTLSTHDGGRGQRSQEVLSFDYTCKYNTSYQYLYPQ